MDSLAILTKQLLAMWADFIRLLPSLAIGVAIVVLTWLAARLARGIVDRLMTRTDLRPRLQELIKTLVTIGIWVFGLMIAATVMMPSLTPASILAGLGIGTVAIGFAFQDIFENFLAGVLIMLRRKMRIGDFIECEGIKGKVEHISLRETHVRKLSNELTVVPNSLLFKNPVEIYTDDARRRHEVIVGVGYDEDLDRAAAVIEAAVRSCDLVDADRRIDVFASAFNSSSMDFVVRWWAGSKPYDMHSSRDQVVRAVKRALDEAGIELPYPYVTNIFKGAMPIEPAGMNARPLPEEELSCR